MALPNVIQLSEYRSGEFFERISRGPGTYIQVCEIRGNSILSSVFIESLGAGASVKVNYFDTTTGAQVGERYDLNSHDLINDPTPNTYRILVSRIHHRIICEVIVAGGTATFSVYGTAVPTTTSDLDQALIRDGDSFEQPTDKALVAGILDEADGKLYFLRGTKGILSVSEDLGIPIQSKGAGLSTQNATIVLITAVVPALKKWRVRSLEAQSRLYGYFTVWLDAVQIAKSNSSPSCENPRFQFDPFINAIAGQTLEVRFTQSFGPIGDLSAFLFSSEFDA